MLAWNMHGVEQDDGELKFRKTIRRMRRLARIPSDSLDMDRTSIQPKCRPQRKQRIFKPNACIEPNDSKDLTFTRHSDPTTLSLAKAVMRNKAPSGFFLPGIVTIDTEAIGEKEHGIVYEKAARSLNVELISQRLLHDGRNFSNIPGILKSTITPEELMLQGPNVPNSSSFCQGVPTLGCNELQLPCCLTGMVCDPKSLSLSALAESERLSANLSLAFLQSTFQIPDLQVDRLAPVIDKRGPQNDRGTSERIFQTFAFDPSTARASTALAAAAGRRDFENFGVMSHLFRPPSDAGPGPPSEALWGLSRMPL